MSVQTYTQQQTRRSRRTFWIIVGTLVALALIGFTATVWVRARAPDGDLLNKRERIR